MDCEQYRQLIARLLTVADEQTLREVYRVVQYICLRRQKKRQDAPGQK